MIIIGKPVEANYRGSSNYFPGKVSGINSDGTYNIAYDDGDAEDNIKRSYIRTTEAAKATEANSNNANTSGTIGTGDFFLLLFIQFLNSQKLYVFSKYHVLCHHNRTPRSSKRSAFAGVLKETLWRVFCLIFHFASL